MNESTLRSWPSAIDRGNDCAVWPKLASSYSSWSAPNEQADTAIAMGADGLIAQGCEAGGHIAGDTEALTFLPAARRIAAAPPGSAGRRHRERGRHPCGVGGRRRWRGRRHPFPVDTRVARPSRIPAPDLGRRQDVPHDVVRARAGPRRTVWWPTPRPGAGATTTDGREAGAATRQRRQWGAGEAARPRAASVIEHADAPGCRCSPLSPRPSECPPRRWTRTALYAGRNGVADHVCDLGTAGCC